MGSLRKRGMGKIPTFIISLPSAEEAYLSVVAQLDKTVFDVHEPCGFPGRLVPDCVCLALTRDPASVNNKGALGCMLAHIRVWEVVSRMDVPYALILEDDVLSSGLSRVPALELPESFDLAFCNDRTAPVPAAGTEDSAIFFANISSALFNIAKRRRSIGTDAYFVSPSGARKLVEYCKQDYYFGHIDVRMLAYSVTTQQLEENKDAGPMVNEMLYIRKITKDKPLLSTFYGSVPLFTHIGVESRRILEDRKGREGPEKFLAELETALAPVVPADPG
jgi:hypothetical protein